MLRSSIPSPPSHSCLQPLAETRHTLGLYSHHPARAPRPTRGLERLLLGVRHGGLAPVLLASRQLLCAGSSEPGRHGIGPKQNGIRPSKCQFRVGAAGGHSSTATRPTASPSVCCAREHTANRTKSRPIASHSMQCTKCLVVRSSAARSRCHASGCSLFGFHNLAPAACPTHPWCAGTPAWPCPQPPAPREAGGADGWDRTEVEVQRGAARSTSVTAGRLSSAGWVGTGWGSVGRRG